MSNGRALRAVREQRQLDIDEVASVASISNKKLEIFEGGEAAPSRRQLQRLSEIYGVPVYSLASDRIPNLPPLPEDYRTAVPGPASLSPKGLKALWASERIAHFTKQLATELSFEAPDWSVAARRANDPQARATAFRQSFDEWLHSRKEKLSFAGSPEQKFLGAFRLFLEVQGSVVNVNDAPADDYFGFYTKPDGGSPTIFVNRSIQSKKAQLFTLAHECAHALMGKDGISNPFMLKNSIERDCNKFAAEFIAPAAEFQSVASSKPASIRGNLSEFISKVSADTFLSKHATAIRLIETGFITQAQYRGWARIWVQNVKSEKEEEKEESESNAGGNPHAKRISELGTLPIYLSFMAIKEGLIDRYDVVSGLNLSEGLQDRAYDLAARRLGAALPK
ncbi:XRE family transcriptional regulator [Azorhizobium sp. AG788]|uniref:XRE family transcriptional regulator n=1 Tax=Azorhizobium sp. AG788 TaxID=2183897 RepID=UPI003138FAB1